MEVGKSLLTILLNIGVPDDPFGDAKTRLAECDANEAVIDPAEAELLNTMESPVNVVKPPVI